jgi:UDP-N-acetylmuramoyl-L-alanyl-D-glutamate--2,6-diaminopimelate ligase
MTQNSHRTFRQYLDALGDLCRSHTGNPDLAIRGATSDSRSVEPGWLFCAIRGSRTDGTRYIPDALARGAVAVAVPDGTDVPAAVPAVVVTDAYAAAGRIAEVTFGFPARGLALYGITGTNGKTTTAFILRDILAAAGIRTGLVGTVRYDVGDGVGHQAARTTPTPFELQALLADMVRNGLQAAVLEASSHALHQRRLGQARFAGALFTNLTRDHFDYHPTFDDYFAAKQILFDECLPPGSPAVVNIDDAYGKRLANHLIQSGHKPLITVGRAADAVVRISSGTSTHTASRLTLDGPRPITLSSPLIGDYNLENVALAAALALALDLPDTAIKNAIRDCHGAPGRLQAVPNAAGFSVFIDYAHTDDALRNVLRTLRKLNPRKLIVVFGCGGDRDSTKRPLMGQAAVDLADRIIVTSDNPRSEKPEQIIEQIIAGMPRTDTVTTITDRRKAICAAVECAAPGDILLIAGKGHETYQEINGEFEPFDDAVEARNALEKRRERRGSQIS